MARKEFTFRGKTLLELSGITVEEFGRIAGARVRRSVKRGLDEKLVKKIEKAFEEKKSGKEPKAIRTHLRHFPVLPKLVGMRVELHKGNGFQVIEVRERMVGHLLGEFALTRKRLVHGKAGIGATKSSTAITARG